MKVVIAGGGTGGHLYPGIAIARQFLASGGNEVLFIGTKRGLEARVLPKERLPLRVIEVGRLKGMKPGSMARTLLTLPVALIRAVRLLSEIRPDVVIGVGGYSSGPVALAAWILRRPLIIVEPNSYPGLANRLLGRVAKKVVLTFPGTNRLRFFSAWKAIQAGPLVRSGIEQGDREKALRDFHLETGRYTIFVMGGSGGAHAINMTMKDAAQLLRDLPGIQVLHQTGERDVQAVTAGYREAGVKATVLPYIHDMAGAYAAADLVVSRAGATTVAELAVCGKRAVLIPYPYAADNHQEHNARTLAEAGAAEMIIQSDLTPARFADAIKRHSAGSEVPVRRIQTEAAREIVRICGNYV